MDVEFLHSLVTLKTDRVFLLLNDLNICIKSFGNDSYQKRCTELWIGGDLWSVRALQCGSQTLASHDKGLWLETLLDSVLANHKSQVKTLWMWEIQYLRLI
jgi:hypothetical protein